MSGGSIGGRMHAPRVTAIATAAGADGRVALASPLVGEWHPHVALGAVIRGGDVIGALEVLGASKDVIAPAGAHGAVIESIASGRAVTAVGHGSVLLVVDPSAAVGAAAAGPSATSASSASGLVFVAPLSGRFFARPGPGKPPFVTVGAIVEAGQTLCMLEVMKTFHRVTYGGAGLPERARVAAILVDDEADVTTGQAILQVEAAP
jgi:acetyl-CoA carboxylase biotin carboxyl carrier protein